MIIELHISSALHKNIPDFGKNLVKDQWEFRKGTDIGTVLKTLNLSEIGLMLILNSRQGTRRDILHDGDTLKIFALIAGG